MIFLGLKFWPKLVLWVAKKTKGIFGVAKKGLREFWGYAKKVVIFFGRQILKS